jgi:heterodisulfide reductase subunit A2
MPDQKIGVYVCHCGTNIAGTVDVKAVSEFAATLPGVVIARNYQFMCSDPGQDLIKKDIADLGLTRVVVASCSPLMHEPTFRKACAEGGLNPYLYEMANIREHCSWVTEDKHKATEKAKALVAGAVYRVALQEELFPKTVAVNPAVLVVGGGIAGIEAALRIADSGKKVYLVEKEPSIGGHMAMLDKTFPTLDCSACILTPKMVQVRQHPNITLLTYTEVTGMEGYIGNFKVKLKRKARMVDETKCNSCGTCMAECPATAVPQAREIKVEGRLIQSFPAGVRGNGNNNGGK